MYYFECMNLKIVQSIVQIYWLIIFYKNRSASYLNFLHSWKNLEKTFSGKWDHKFIVKTYENSSYYFQFQSSNRGARKFWQIDTEIPHANIALRVISFKIYFPFNPREATVVRRPCSRVQRPRPGSRPKMAPEQIRISNDKLSCYYGGGTFWFCPLATLYIFF